MVLVALILTRYLCVNVGPKRTLIAVYHPFVFSRPVSVLLDRNIRIHPRGCPDPTRSRKAKAPILTVAFHKASSTMADGSLLLLTPD